MISFTCDYNEGAHPLILERLLQTNLQQEPGYGADAFTASAKARICEACACPSAEVFLLTGGTQTNSTVIATMLRDYQGAIAAETGHIAVHEAGAVEYTGHKVLTLPSHEGKMRADDLRAYLGHYYADGSYDHMVFPGLVYISFPTEYGTLYSLAELKALREVCDQYKLPLFVDGARLGYGLMSPACDVTLQDLAALCDVFTIGGTKVGALCGEAVVFPHGAPEHFFTMVKQHGALLAKGRVLGIQFDVLFTDGLYFKIAKNAIDLAMEMKAMFVSKGYELFLDSPTNQQFILLTPAAAARLEGQVAYEVWDTLPDGRMITRFATSWATTREQISALAALL
ncbi:MAG: low specificity L-threonine aldolase [Bacteroidales bacterium]|nr:low specificity L-threonine aldolase [Bacteroidales bacterium]